jgi:hypothetical protein
MHIDLDLDLAGRDSVDRESARPGQHRTDARAATITSGARSVRES